MIQEAIVDGQTVLGIKLGSTRIKACLIGDDGATLGTGTHHWENQYCDGMGPTHSTQSGSAFRTATRPWPQTLSAGYLEPFRDVFAS